jgi:hypothetical protein
MSQKHRIIVPNDVKPKPEKHELEAAETISEYFGSDVEFIKRANGKTADIKVVATGANWEIKSPTGKGKNNVQHNIQAAASQSPNIIFDSRRSKIHQTKLLAEVKYQFRLIKKAKKLLFISKDKKVIDITR